VITPSKPISIILFPLVMDIYHIESVDMARQITQQCKEDIDTKVKSATRNKEHPKWGNEDLFS